jgi:hypothetical protein
MLPDLASLAAAISHHWPLDLVHAGQVLQHGRGRATVAFSTGQGDIVVKAYGMGHALGLVAPSLDQVDRQLGVLDHLSRSGFGHAPTLLPTRDGARFAQVEGLTIVVHERVEGRTPPNLAATWAELGRMVLVDWDQAGRGPRVLEAGYPLITQFVSLDCEVDEAAARAFYGAYTGGEGMDRTEQNAVFAAAIFHALRYLPFADTGRRWNRILFAIDHRERLLATMTSRT